MRWLAALLFVVTVPACTTETVTECSCIPSVTRAFVRGTVLDAQMVPVQGADISPLGQLKLNCSVESGPVVALPDNTLPNDAVTDASGGFSLLLGLVGDPGEHCVDLVVFSSTLTASDTIRAVPAIFVEGPQPDTTEVVLNVTW